MKDKINKIVMVIQKYVNLYANKDIVDYYDLFSLDKSWSNEKLKLELKKYLILFHPDMLGMVEANLPTEFISYFKEISDSISDIIDILTDERKKVEYDNKLEEYASSNIQLDLNDKELECYNKLKSSVMANLNKYGVYNSINCLTNFLNSGSTKYFTRDENARNNLNNIYMEDIYKLLNKITNTEDKFKISEQFVKLILNEKEKYLRNASLDTYEKYGYAQLFAALNELYSTFNYQRFTNKNNDRKNMKENIRNCDMYIILSWGLGLESIYNKESAISVEDLIKKYCDKIITLSKEMEMEEETPKY